MDNSSVNKQTLSETDSQKLLSFLSGHQSGAEMVIDEFEELFIERCRKHCCDIEALTLVGEVANELRQKYHIEEE